MSPLFSVIAAVSAASIGSAAIAADIPSIVRTDGAVVRYDEPGGRYCIAFDATTASRPPQVDCKPMKAWTDVGIMIIRR